MSARLRVVVSGTHASGKTTLIDDFVDAHPGIGRWGDPYELVDDAFDAPDAAAFAEQLALSAHRLLHDDESGTVIAERGPIDFLAYLAALVELGRAAAGSLDRARARTAEAMQRVDLLVVLPLPFRDDLPVAADEDPELRAAMNDALLDLVDDPALVGDARVVEVSGDRDARLAALESAVASLLT
ncbi:AAA family ATPase [Agromyces mangrovi Wang et al. 2018]|uniref:AAA family ATPase n=1 Tax=Agromyces mangrovi TaxID=1858653 RepID=UPI002572F163|nr:AAA family ATPase [Agromyces mangrovi]BDZ65405.1 hypothetical protein GCM10025877_23430 [Agromyces mangrovi]